jgi:HD-GYP domain-containing protein (c-di-GMP phosphodiesterase class II)
MNATDILRNASLFQELSSEELEILAEAADHIKCDAGEVLIREGELSTDLWVIGEGRAHALSLDDQGSSVTLNIFRDGDYFGEMSFIDDEPRSATVEAITSLQALRISRKIFDRIIQNYPPVAINFMKGLSLKIRKATSQIEDLVFIVAQEELHNAHLDTIRRLALAAEFKDGETGAHLDRVSRYSELLARGYGLSEEETEDIRNAAPMHDIGKIGIPESILLKPGRFNEEERKTMQSHTTIGEKILNKPGSDLLHRAREIAGGHHERFDGNGYPRGMKRGGYSSFCQDCRRG